MKRLIYYFGQIQISSLTNLKMIYKGECVVWYKKPNGEDDSDLPGEKNDNVYWEDDMNYKIEPTNRMALTRPTITISIPVKRLGITDFTPAAADYCLRRIKPYFDEINAEYANKARPDSENGKFLIYEQRERSFCETLAFSPCAHKKTIPMVQKIT